MTDQPFFDRRAERGIFAEMLDSDGGVRVLAIGDDTNKGKTFLLQQLESMAFDRDVPVAFASPAELSEPDTIAFADRIREQLDDRVAFPRFMQMTIARSQGDFDTIVNSGHLGDVDYMDMTGASFEGANQPMVARHQANVLEPHAPVTIRLPEPAQLLDAQKPLARLACMNAFAADLRAAAAEAPLALLIDTYEGYPGAVQDWIASFLRRHLIDHPEGPPARIAIAIAGQSLPPFEKWNRRRVQRHVSKRQLDRWPQDDFAEALRQFGFVHEPEQVPALYAICAPMGPKDLVAHIQNAARAQRGI